MPGPFHKIKMHFIRKREASIPFASAAKNYGMWGEDEFAYFLQSYLPRCRFKRNVIIETPEGNAEIDCILLYENKLFAIEIKRWKGYLTETEDGFLQRKVDRWTGEIHAKYHKSPFKQLNRAIYLLKKQIPIKAWINPIVYFDEAQQVAVSNGQVFFTEMQSLIFYIVNEGKETFGNHANPFFEACTLTDRLYTKARQKLDCMILENALCFQFPNAYLTKRKIHSIHIRHAWYYDVLTIRTIDGNSHSIKIENGYVLVTINSRAYRYAFCKLDYIEIGQNKYKAQT